MQRFAVVGTSGSGKTTFAKKLSQKLDLAHYELDTFFWKPGWTESCDSELSKKVQETITGPRWVVCGNYRSVREILWPQADCIIWLDYPLYLCLWQGLKRTLRRIRTQEACCNGNYEKIHLQFFSRKSIFIWIATTHKKRKQEYSRLLKEGKYPIVRLRSPRDAEKWLTAFGC